MDTLRWVLCVFLGGPAAVMLLLNWVAMVSSLRARKAYSFGLPFLWGISGALGCVICPAVYMQRLAWVPLALDPSILLMVLVPPLTGLRKLLRGRVSK